MTLRRITALIAITLALGFVASCGGTTKAKPRTADETVTWVAQGLANEQPGVIWEAMPPSYQADVTSLVHEFANSMDPEVYNKVFAVAGKIVDVLKNKRDVILASSMFEQAQVDPEKASQNWDNVVGIFDSLVSSDLADLEKLKTADPGDLLSSTGSAMMQHAAAASKMSEDDPYAKEFKAKVAAMQVEVLESTESTATLRITVPDEEPEEMQMVRVEEKWVPKDMADEWSGAIAEARTKIAELGGEEFQQNKMQAMMGLGMVEAMVDQVATIESPEELDQMLQGMMGNLLGGLGQGMGE
jgi:hypothetical protein